MKNMLPSGEDGSQIVGLMSRQLSDICHKVLLESGNHFGKDSTQGLHLVEHGRQFHTLLHLVWLGNYCCF